MRIDPESKTAKACRQVLLRDAEAWTRRGPRRFVRTPNSGLRLKEREENNAIFARQNAEADESLRTFYEEFYVRYGGDLDDLPWVKGI